MSSFFIGDIQGCCEQLQQLLAKISDGADKTGSHRFLFAGDLVNRGPQSLETLRLVRQLEQQGLADSVLGNHDLHLLAVANGLRPMHKSDTLQEILAAPDCDSLLEWLRQRPLAILEQGHLLIHAGLYPSWSIARTLSLAAEVEQQLRGPDWLTLLANMYGNSPAEWSEQLSGMARWRCIINSLTRMRFCSADGQMDFASKDGVGAAPPGFAPWFELPRASAGQPVAFGHWSTLGLINQPDLLSLDTGCVWGGRLTAISADHQQVYQIDCPQQQRPGKH